MEERTDKKPSRLLVLGLVVVAVLGLIFVGAVLFLLLSGGTGSGHGQSSRFAGLGSFGFGKKCIAVIHLDTEIISQDVQPSLLGSGQPGSETIASQIRGEAGKPGVAAILLDINSPGGSVVATHDIYRALQNVTKPKVAYIGEVGASGAYYVAAATDYIVSDPDALTANIGARMTIEDYTGFMGKLGVNFTNIKSGAHKDIGDPTKQMDTDEYAILQSIINESFDEFRNVVETNRGSRLAPVLYSQALDGRVMSGRQALAAGLVDALGSKQDAVSKAASLANLTDSDYDICDVDSGGRTSMLQGLSTLIQPQSAQLEGIYFK